MKVTGFRIMESKINKGSMILIAKTEDGKEYVIGSDPHCPQYLELLETAFDNGFDRSIRGKD